MKIKEAIKNFFIENLARFIISFVVVILITILYNLSHNGWKTIVAYIDSTFISSIVLFCISGLSFVNQQGTFDIFAYTFSKKKRKEQNEEFYDFTERRNLERKATPYVPLPYLFVGILSFIISIILLLISRAIFF